MDHKNQTKSPEPGQRTLMDERSLTRWEAEKKSCVGRVIRMHACTRNCQRTESDNKKEVTATVLGLQLLISETKGHSMVLYVLRVMNSKTILLLVYRFPSSVSTVFLTSAGQREPSMCQKKMLSFLPATTVISPSSCLWPDHIQKFRIYHSRS